MLVHIPDAEMNPNFNFIQNNLLFLMDELTLKSCLGFVVVLILQEHSNILPRASTYDLSQIKHQNLVLT